MQKFNAKVTDELTQRSKYCIPVVELYSRDTVDIASNAAPSSAFGRFATTCFTWTNNDGSYEYTAKVLEFPEISMYLDGRVNSADITLSNVERGPNSTSKFVLDNKIKGSWLVIRLIYPNQPNESTIVFWGKADRPGGINTETVTLTAKQDLGNYGQEIPFRDYGVRCPLEFAKPGGGCLGDETLTEKSIAYQQAVAEFGSAGCNKLPSTCLLLSNIRLFQGQKVLAVSGQFSYITVEEVVKRVLFWTKRKKIQTVKVDNWSSVNQSEGSETIPLAFGRCQIQGHPFTWADVGTQVKSLYGFCEGKISAFNFIRSRTQGINIVSVIEHLGDWGGVGSQQPDTLFDGASGHNSRLAYLEVITDGSSPTQVDDAPLVTAVIKGLEIPTPDENNEFTINQSSNNPVYVTRFILTDPRFGRMPESRMDDEINLETAADCDSIVEDRTNEEALVLPANEATNYGYSYRRFRSTGRVSAYKLMYDNGDLGFPELIENPPEFEEPEIRWFDPFLPYNLPPSRSVLRQKYTFNGALQEKTSLLDFLYERVLPTFRGFISYGQNGKLQIKNRRKADNTYVRAAAKALETKISVTNVAPWRNNLEGYLLIGVSLEQAEIRKIRTYEYSTACNGMPITATNIGGVTATTVNLSGGSATSPATGFVTLDGSPEAGDEVVLTFDSGDNEFSISYIADGIEDLNTFTIMLKEFLNANVQFAQYLTATIDPNNLAKIVIRCESGYLVLDKALEYSHAIGEEVLRVQAVFENCGELTANDSAQFDNIIENSFKWNEDEEDEVNAVVAKYTSAVDDFHLTSIMPRAGWDTIDLEGELVKEELDLTFVDNYWQAAYLTKGQAIDRIDGNLHFSFSTTLLALQLELGDVVAVRHDSGDGALNYVPCWITKSSVNLNDFQVDLTCKLYLSAAFDYHVQPVEPLLTTTLNPNAFPGIVPDVTGSSGGTSVSTEPVVFRPDGEYYKQYAQLGVYSPTGVDIV